MGVLGESTRRRRHSALSAPHVVPSNVMHVTTIDRAYPRRPERRSGPRFSEAATNAFTNSAVDPTSPWQKSSRHSTVPASRRTALRLGHILPVCSLIAPCPAGAGTVSVLARLSPRTATLVPRHRCQPAAPGPTGSRTPGFSRFRDSRTGDATSRIHLEISSASRVNCCRMPELWSPSLTAGSSAT